MILFFVVFVGGFLSAGTILKKALSYVHIEGVTITTHSPFQFVDVAMNLGFFMAVIVSVPYIIYSLYTFIVPALTKDEKKKLLKSVPVSMCLFIIGFLYGFFILYYALGLLASINTDLGIANFWNISQFLSQIIVTATMLGLVYEFPLFLTILIKVGIITTKTLIDHRRMAYFILFLLVSLLPPTDGISLVAMSLPLVLLYEVTILLNNKINYVWTRI